MSRATPTLKRKCLHFDEIFITGCTMSCQNDNFRCSQWLKFRQNDDIFVSVALAAVNHAISTHLSYQQLTDYCSNVTITEVGVGGRGEEERAGEFPYRDYVWSMTSTHMFIHLKTLPLLAYQTLPFGYYQPLIPRHRLCTCVNVRYT